MTGRRAVVTGGAGFIGSHLVEALVRAGYDVVVLDDFSTGREANLGGADGVEIVRGDLGSEDVTRRALSGADVVFHLGAIPSVPKTVAEPAQTNEVNVTGTLRVLECARREGVERVVFAGSCAVYGNSPETPKCEGMPVRASSPYALQKIAGEEYCRLYSELYDLETVALRFFNVFGPRQDPASDYAAVIPRFVSAALQGHSPTVYGDGEQTRDFVYVGDVAAASLRAAEAEAAAGQVMNIAGGRQVSLNLLLREIGEALGTPVAAQYAAERAGDVRHSEADIQRAGALLGWKPEVPLREGLARTIEYFRGNR